MKISFEWATENDMIEARDIGFGWDGWSDGRLKCLPILGYVARDEAGSMQGIGVVAWIGPTHTGYAVGSFYMTEEFRRHPSAPMVHRRALIVIERVLNNITDRIVAQPDPKIPNAAAWLKRLGFVDEGEDWVRYKHANSGNGSISSGDGGIVHDAARTRAHDAGCGERECGADRASG